MPRIIVTTTTTDGDGAPAVLYQERVGASDLESEHFAHQLLERLEWAVLDADEAERDGRATRSGGLH